MFAPLGVSKVGTVVLVNGETETTLEASDMVFEEVGVLCEVDVFECELAESFSSVGVGGGVRRDSAAAELGACSIL